MKSLRNHFTRPIALVAFAVAGSGLLLAVGLSAANPGFSERDVKGRYTFVTDGEFLQGPLTGPAVAIGYFDFDGQGFITFATQTANIAGVIFSEGETASGVYSIDPDGTGQLEVFPDNNPSVSFTYDVVLVNKREMHGVSTFSDGVFRTVITKQKKASN